MLEYGDLSDLTQVPLDLLDEVPYTYLGGPTKTYTSVTDLENDVVEIPGVGRYWPVAQRTTEWLWMTGKQVSHRELASFDTLDKEPVIQLTASQVAAILGVDPSTHRNAVHTLKTAPDKLPEPSMTLQAILNWGVQNEPVARDVFTGVMRECEDEKIRYLYELGTFQHGLYSWLGASPDGGFTALPYKKPRDVVNNLTGALEIKCPYKLVIPSGVPVHHMVQMQVQMACMGLQKMLYFVYTPNEGKWWSVNYSPDLFNKIIVPECEHFLNHLLKCKHGELPNFGRGEKKQMREAIMNYCPESKLDNALSDTIKMNAIHQSYLP